MADRARDDDTREDASSSPRGSSRPTDAGAFADASGPTSVRQRRERPEAALEVATRATARGLRALGLAQTEAVSLADFMCGIPVGKRRWRLFELNRVLVLRAMRGEGYIQGRGASH
jgi:hypothetical protein